MTIISTTEARKQFASLVERVFYHGENIAVGRRGQAELLIIPYPQILSGHVNEITNINANSSSFDFLNNEPDLYSVADLKKRYA